MENNNQGGGIPDEARQRLNKIGDTEVNNLFDNGITVNKAILRGMERCAHEGYSLASEEISRLKIALKDVTKAFKSNVVYEKHEFSPAYLELLKEISRLKEENERLRGGCIGKEYECTLATMLENLPQNYPLYKDSGLWQVRSDNMAEVVYQQKVNESFFDFIKRVFDIDNTFNL